ncbi:ADP-ribosylation factor-like protein 4A [Condylostylus longicornis]|uniref:ADP-ribosylation factor-like protein 4A n=1 Tax=Condylostylus longicornis TaxID=2530218 RepID=UPI00244DB017|nr:ADP-ribosylation factor-like protein 4A [Condylostylus longicornis]XP_055372501.1 ADP-ribosylation factor-like protein 4A [Condylostylus longicornis]XP_055372511.1 ADP-ribosylation factor-like protein 4A [Condylostylus longicornis]XP_055372520.1 ADP-ribosylation factor-like protein 4A [Condylostylus longicornis]
MGATMGKNGGNILDSLPSTQGTLHIVMLGLDSAGKTTALYRLKFDQYLNTVPTIGFNCEKIRGTVGKAKGVQFLVWDVGGQEKLRPLWRSYTRCTDGIVFVIDSVDVERMEEAKMELMRTAKCPDNQGVPVLILANKQDLPGAREPKELEKLLSLHELSTTYVGYQNSFTHSISISPSSNNPSGLSQQQQTQQQQQQQQTSDQTSIKTNNSSQNINTAATTPIGSCGSNISTNNFGSSNKTNSSLKQQQQQHQQQRDDLKTTITSNNKNQLNKSISTEIKSDLITSVTDQHHHHQQQQQLQQQQQQQILTQESKSDFKHFNLVSSNSNINNSSSSSNYQNFKGWYIQPACAITGEGLQEGLDALYDMITKKRKMNKINKKKR